MPQHRPTFARPQILRQSKPDMPVELLANQFEVLQMPSHESDVLLIDAGTSHEAVLDRVLAALGEAR